MCFRSCWSLAPSCTLSDQTFQGEMKYIPCLTPDLVAVMRPEESAAESPLHIWEVLSEPPEGSHWNYLGAKKLAHTHIGWTK